MMKRPNILWLMTDEQRTDSLGCYGSPWAQTPNIDRLADEGVLLRTAVTPSPVCIPARTSIMTAQYPHQTGIRNNSVDVNQPMPSLVEPFRAAGYATASFGKRHYVGERRHADGDASAFDTEICYHHAPAVSFWNYADTYNEADYDVVKYPLHDRDLIVGGRFPADASETAEATAVSQGIEWLEAHDCSNPFFLRISFNGPHTPVVPPAPFDRLMDNADISFPAASAGPRENRPAWETDIIAAEWSASRITAEQINKMRRYYYGEVAFIDSQFGRLLDWMQDHHLLDNTIVALVSDHGTALGDYGLIQKGTFYEPVVNVPYVFWYPNTLAKGKILETPVETLSLLPTLLELVGLPMPAEHQHQSLAECLRTGTEPQARPVFSEIKAGQDCRLAMVRENDWKLTACIDPDLHDVALYNLADDPCESRNLAEDAASFGIKTHLLDLMTEHLTSTKDPSLEGCPTCAR